MFISFLDSAESVFEKAKNSSPSATCGREKIDPRQIAPRQRLDQAQFHHQRLDSDAVHETFRRARASVVSQSATRSDWHHLDRACFVFSSNARYQCPDRSDLVDVAQGDQATEGTGLSHSSSAVD